MDSVYEMYISSPSLNMAVPIIIATKAADMILTKFHPMNKWMTHALYIAEVKESGCMCFILWLGYLAEKKLHYKTL